MYSSSRGILYTAPPTDEERTENSESTAADSDEGEPSAEGAIEADAGIEDTSPTDSRADWTGDLPADD